MTKKTPPPWNWSGKIDMRQGSCVQRKNVKNCIARWMQAWYINTKGPYGFWPAELLVFWIWNPLTSWEHLLTSISKIIYYCLWLVSTGALHSRKDCFWLCRKMLHAKYCNPQIQRSSSVCPSSFQNILTTQVFMCCNLYLPYSSCFLYWIPDHCDSVLGEILHNCTKDAILT